MYISYEGLYIDSAKIGDVLREIGEREGPENLEFLERERVSSGGVG